MSSVDPNRTAKVDWLRPATALDDSGAGCQSAVTVGAA